MDDSSAIEDDPALLTLELILFDLAWIRLPKLNQDRLLIPTLCFKVLDFPLVTFSPHQDPIEGKPNAVFYNQGKSCIFRTSLQLLSEQFHTYPIYSFLMDTGSQPAPMVAFGSFPLQAVRGDISSFTKDSSGWPTVSAQHGQAYLRNTRGKRVALINFALRLSCLSESGGGVFSATGEPLVAVPAQRPIQRLHPASEVNRSQSAAATTDWPRWEHPLTGEEPTTSGTGAIPTPAAPSESFVSAREVRGGRSLDRHRLPGPAVSAAAAESAQEMRTERLTDHPPVAASVPEGRHVAWGAEQRRHWDGRCALGGPLTGGPPPLQHPHPEDAPAGEGRPRAAPPLGRSSEDSRGAAPPAARSRSSSAERPPEPGGGSCWRAPLETDEGSLASDASSGPIVSRLIQELAAMQRATAESRHVAVQTRPLRDLQLKGPPLPSAPPPPPIPPIRGGARRRARPPRLRRPPLISEEPVTEGFARRRPTGAPRRPLPPPDTTAVDRLSRGQPVAERRPGGRLRAPPPRLRPVTLTRTAQLRLARHMADVRHDLHAQEYGRRRDRWLAEQRRRAGRNRPRAPLPATGVLTVPEQTSPQSGRAAHTRRRQRRQATSQPPQSGHATAVRSIGVQFEADRSPPPMESRVKATGTITAPGERQSSPLLSSFVEPRVAASPARSTESRADAGNGHSPPGLSTVKTPSDVLNSTGGPPSLSRSTTAESPSPDRAPSSPGAGRSQSATAARVSTEAVTRSRSETAHLAAAGRRVSSSDGSPSPPSEPRESVKPVSTSVRPSVSAGRRLRSSSSAARPASGRDKTAEEPSSGGRGSGGRSKSPSGGQGRGNRAASAGSGRRSSSGDSVSSSTLRTDRHVSEELVVAVIRRPPPGAASSVETESGTARTAVDGSRHSGRRTSAESTSTQSAPTKSAPTQSVPTQSAPASEVEERISASYGSSSTSGSSSEEDSSETASSESSSSLTESQSRTETQTQALATQTSSSSDRLPPPARRSGKSPVSGGRQKPSTGAKPKPAPRGPPTWHRVESAESLLTKPAALVNPSTTAAPSSDPSAAPNPTPGLPPSAAGRSRSSSRDSAEIDARIAMFLRQTGERRQEQERRRRQDQETAAASPVGSGWLRGSSGGAAAGGSSWLKAWRVEEDALPPAGAAGRRTSRGRHTLSQQVAGLNTNSVSSYAPSELEGGTLSDLTPP